MVRECLLSPVMISSICTIVQKTVVSIGESPSWRRPSASHLGLVLDISSQEKVFSVEAAESPFFICIPATFTELFSVRGRDY